MVACGDDDERSRISEILTRGGFEIHCSAKGQEAIEIFLEDDDLSIVLLDDGLLSGKGRGFGRQLRALSGKAGRTAYIILLTRQGAGDDLIGALRSGVDDFIARPFDDATLVARVQVGVGLVRLMAKETAEGGDLVRQLIEEHATLRELAALLEFVEGNIEQGMPRAMTEWCISTAFLADFDVHATKENAYIEKFQKRVGKEQTDWFADISRTTFETLLEQHEHLLVMGKRLRRDLTYYIKVKKELAPLMNSVGGLEISYDIGDRDDDLESNLADVRGRLEEYYKRRTKLIEALRASIKSYLKFIPEHFALEEQLFFPFSSKYLTVEDQAVLERRFAYIEEKAGRAKLKEERQRVKKLLQVAREGGVKALSSAETL